MSEISLYQVPKGANLIEDYIIRIRAFGTQEWKTIRTYRVWVDMHQVREASMAYFDFSGSVEVEITYQKENIEQVNIRPLSRGIDVYYMNKTIEFCINKPMNLSIEINGDRFHNLHLFAGEINTSVLDVEREHIHVLKGNLERPSIHRTEELTFLLEKMPEGRTLYFGPGIHYLEECSMRIPSNTNIYISGGAIVVGTFICNRTENIRIFGKGILYLRKFERFSGLNGVRLSHTKNITIEDIIMINPPHYSVYVGDSEYVSIKRIKSFSCEGWSDGIDVMSSRNVNVEGVFLRTSDDCIAIYGTRWDYQGDSRNLTIKNSTLWADVAHPICIGTHGNHEKDGDVIEDIHFYEIDILEHHELQEGYLGCMAINPGDKNIVRNITFEKIRIEPFEHGKLLDIQVKFNPDYNPAPGRRIENIYFNDITYNGFGEVTSVIQGYDKERMVSNITFNNIVINGKQVRNPAEAKIEVGDFTENIIFT